jgi:hypothetical protein
MSVLPILTFKSCSFILYHNQVLSVGLVTLLMFRNYDFILTFKLLNLTLVELLVKSDNLIVSTSHDMFLFR